MRRGPLAYLCAHGLRPGRGGRSRSFAPQAGTVVLTTNTYESASLHDLVAAATQGQGRVLSVASTADTLAVSTIHPETAAAHPLWTADAVLLGDQVRPAQTAKLRAPVSLE